MPRLPDEPETPAEFKRALRDATRVHGFEHLYDLIDKTGLSRATMSPAFSETKSMPSEATITAIVQAMHGDVEAWLARARRVAEPVEPVEPAEPTWSDPNPVVGGGPFPSADGAIGLRHGMAPRSAVLEDHRSPQVGPGPVGSGNDLAGLEGDGSKGGQRRRFVLTGVGGLLVLALVAIVVVGWLAHRGGRSPERTIVIQNEVAIGSADLVEDRSPSYLAVRPIARCADFPGCKLAGTDLGTGDTAQAVCQLQGALLTNANLGSAGIKTNPNAAASSLWYGIRWVDGRRGYINEVYVAPTYRGGLGLPGC